MATLVLTVVGGVLGGPVGAMLGAIAGQQVDAVLFKPKGREGPRLNDLRVQASSYGMQIPQLFGTMRVAGSVIWATDLIERRAKRGGGKGRPSVTEYNYSASFAVALSSRQIRSIKRIWADGNLLRGGDGVFQERCQFRSYDGDADQAVDPLIAGALGPASASAFRGLAYVLFEELELARFGNRIPSLSFEVEADSGLVDVGQIGGALLGDSGRFAHGGAQIGGFAASGDGARAALAPLAEATGMRLVQAGRDWQVAGRGSDDTALAMAGYRAMPEALGSQDIAERQRLSLAALPRKVQLRHYEPARDYQAGQQSADVAGGGTREKRLDLPAVLSAGAARAMAMDMAAAASDGRETIVLAMDLAAMAVPVGRVLDLADLGQWRVAERQIRGNSIRLELRRYQPFAIPASPDVDGGTAITDPDWPSVSGEVQLFGLPNLAEPPSSAPLIVAAAAGANAGWRGADLWWVAGVDAAPQMIGAVRPALALGHLAAPVAPGSQMVRDLHTMIDVQLINPAMELESVSDAEMLAGANRAMLGAEMIQFGSAVPMGSGKWRLTRLLRGRGGSDNDAGMVHDMGTPFVLLDDNALLPLPPALTAAMGPAATVEWAARGSSAMTEVAVPQTGRAISPLRPVHGAARRRDDGGVQLSWIRRSRCGQAWRDGVDAPLGEAQERYRIRGVAGDAEVGNWACAAPQLTLTAAEAGLFAGGGMAEVRQVGDFALSPPLIIPIA